MADADLVVRGGTVVTPHRDVAVADVAVGDGVIVAVGPRLPHTGVEEIDAGRLHVLPGGLDPHVHLNEPGRAAWEGWATGTDALAAGGFTACVDMPLNSKPPTIDVDAFDAKARAAAGAARVDFGLWGGLVPGSLAQIEPLWRRGALGFKAFMSDSGIAEFAAADDLTLLEGMRRCAELGAVVLVHAESEAITTGLARRAIAEGRTGARDFAASRPAVAELEAIARVIFMAGETGCPLHIVHVSTARGVRLVEEARRVGVDVSCETCPHYLLLTEDDLEALGPVAKCAPPLRSSGELAGLWELVASGAVPIVASDHSPCPPEMKRSDDFFRAWGGISGAQTTRQLLFGAERAPVPVLAEATATGPARRFGLASKGAIEVGCDADLALFDLSTDWALTSGELRYRHPQSPFLGRRMKGRLALLLLRGVPAWRDSRPAGPPSGRLLTR